MYTVVMVIYNIRFKTSGRKTYDRIKSVFKKAYICQNALFNFDETYNKYYYYKFFSE